MGRWVPGYGATPTDRAHLYHSSEVHQIRDWSLIMGKGGLQNGKIAGPKLFAPPQDRVKLFAPPLLKSGNFLCPPYNMAKTSSYRVKTTPKLVVPPFSMANTVSDPPFCRGKTSRAPPSRFVAPPRCNY